jgi:polyhydroxyalkanoate synthesis regulator phasin
MSEFSAAKKEILQDFLNTLPVPTHKEMDELYKEIYLLKKRIKELEKKK